MLRILGATVLNRVLRA